MAKTRKNLLALLQPAALRICERIVFLSGERVLLDADLATLYGVTTGALNRAVKRNHGRFPADFMLQRTADGPNSLRCQTGILKTGSFLAPLRRSPAARCARPARDDWPTFHRGRHRG